VPDFAVVVHVRPAAGGGRIRRWGVSNFGMADMEDLYRVPGGEACATN
jgi:diketogulonate reductase-like aldo/keto reductase